MDRSLVVVEPTDRGRELVSLAGEIAEGTGTELVLVRPVDRDDYERDLQRKAQTSKGDIDSLDAIEEQAREKAAQIGDEVLHEDVSYTAHGVVGKLPDGLLAAADDHDCDHVFIAGEERSPTGKVLFGDNTQSVLLNFDGPVTSLIE